MTTAASASSQDRRASPASPASPETQLIFHELANEVTNARSRSVFKLATGASEPVGWTDGLVGVDFTSGNRLERLAGGLFDLSVSNGAAVGILMEHSQRRVEACLAVWEAGAARVLLDPEVGRQSLEAIVSHADMRLLVVDDRYLDLGRDLLDRYAPCCTLAHHGRRHGPGRKAVPWEEMALGQPYRPEVGTGTVAMVTYSVTNGRPDGIPYFGEDLVMRRRPPTSSVWHRPTGITTIPSNRVGWRVLLPTPS